MVVEFVDALPNTRAANYLSGQLTRSGISPALNYGEALGAESKNDFIHKLKIVLKELRETYISLKIVERITSKRPLENIHLITDECNQLISIFVKSIETTKKRKIKNNS